MIAYGQVRSSREEFLHTWTDRSAQNATTGLCKSLSCCCRGQCLVDVMSIVRSSLRTGMLNLHQRKTYNLPYSA